MERLTAKITDKIIPISQFVTDIAACVSHHNCCNVDFKVNAKDFRIAMLLGLVSATPAVPLAALTVKNVHPARFKKYVGIFITLLGLLTLLKIFSGLTLVK